MNMLEPSMPLAPMFRAWLHANTRWFDRRSPAGQALAEKALPGLHFLAEASPPHAPVASIVASEDWDLLFQAVIDRLQRVADDRAVSECTQGTGEVLRECAAALSQLGASAYAHVAPARHATTPSACLDR
jgi:hypothetical protein